jgi:hypothetical protein
LLYGRRKRLAELAAREAAGESFWTGTFDASIRAKIVHAFRDAVPYGDYYEYARDAILHDEGLFYLQGEHLTAGIDLLNYLLNCDDEMVPTVIEAMAQACVSRIPALRSGASWQQQQNAATFEPAVSAILREHRISFDLIGQQMIPFSAKELHQEVVAPALSLLAGRSDLDKVESAYRSALEEIASSKAADAITDAGTALQEMLYALGCQGNALGPLIASAKVKGFLAPHDSPMLAAVDKVLHWVSADRSEKGDAHEVSTATVEDAWFTVHIVGAIILRLSNASTRAS